MLQIADSFESRVSGVVDGLSSAATQLQGTAQTMSEAAEATSKNARKVGAASDQASDNVTTVSSATTQLSGSIDEISQQVSKSSAITRDAVSQAERTNRQVEGLASQAVSVLSDARAYLSSVASLHVVINMRSELEAKSFQVMCRKTLSDAEASKAHATLRPAAPALRHWLVPALWH